MRVVIVEGEVAVLGVNLEHPIVTDGDFAMRLFPNYFMQELFLKCPTRGERSSFDDRRPE